MSTTSYKIIGLDNFQKALQKMIKELKSSTKFFARAGVVGLADVQDHFKKTQSDTGSWKPLKYRNGKPLQKTGRLKNSITYVYSSKGAEIGTNMVYANVHDKGYSKKNIPQRRFLWLSQNGQEKIINQLVHLLEEQK